MTGADGHAVRTAQRIATQRLIGIERGDVGVAFAAVALCHLGVGNGSEIDVATGADGQLIARLQRGALAGQVVAGSDHGAASGA